MLYTVEQGKHEEAVIKQCMRENKPLPKKIQNAPELALGLYLYWGAFWDLDTCRPTGDGVVHPIPWYAIEHWAVVNELDQDQHESLHYIIRQLDNAFIKKKTALIQAEIKTKQSLLKRL